MTSIELTEFHPDGRPIGHPGMSAGLRGFAERANRQAFAPLANRRAARAEDSNQRLGGLLIFPVSIASEETLSLGERAKGRVPAAAITVGDFFSGRFTWSKGDSPAVTWSAESPCLDVAGVDDQELADLGAWLVAEAGCRAILSRSEATRDIHVITADSWRFF